MRTISIRNPDISNSEKTFLSSAYSTGTVATARSVASWQANDLAVFGEPTTEISELKKISSVVLPSTFNLASALNFNHNKDAPIYRTPWDQVEISSFSGGNWSILSTSAIQWDKPFTLYVHTGGDSTYSYRWRFYNSSLGTFSEYSATYSGADFNRTQVGYMIREVRKATRTEGDERTVTDRDIIRQFNEAQDIIYGVHNNWWFLRFDDNTITTTGSVFKYNFDLMGGGIAGTPAATTTLGFIDKIRYNYNDGTMNTIYPLKYKSEDEFDAYIVDNNRQTDDFVNLYTIRPADANSVNGYFEVYPTPKTTGRATFNMRAYHKFPLLSTPVDATPIPVPQVLENYAIMFIERIRGNDAKADYYKEMFFGPPPTEQTRRALTGIPLLEQLNAQAYPTGQPRSLIKYRGYKAMSRLYGRFATRAAGARDYLHENYWGYDY